MSGTVRAGSYRSLLADRRLARVFGLAMVGRFGHAVLPLCLLFTISQATRSFAVAATATALFGASGLAMPLQSRLLDRQGQARVLPVVGGLFMLFLVGASTMGALAVTSPVAWLGACLVGGLCAPSLGPSMRAQWREAVEEERRTAYSLDAIAEEAVFFLGPLAASGVLLLGPAWYGVLAVAVLIPVGVSGLATSPFGPPPRRPAAAAPASTDRLGPLRSGGFRRLLLVMCLAGAAPSAAMTCVAAVSDRAAMPAVTGIVEVAAGAASLLGGWLWGRRPAGARWQGELAVLLAARAPVMIACTALPTLWAVSALVALTGVAMAPTYIAGFTASDDEAEVEHHTEASTWVTAASNIGISVGAGVAGWFFTTTGAAAVFAGAALALAVGSVLAWTAPARRPASARRRARVDGQP